MIGPAAFKWEVYTDDDGNMYFYNTLTGESVWELPPDEEDDDIAPTASQLLGPDDPANVDSAATVHPTAEAKTEYSAVEVAIEVADAMLDLLDKVDTRISSTRDHKSELAAPQISSKMPAKKKKFASPAAEARTKKNEANDAKRRKRVREKAAAVYLQIALSDTRTDGRSSKEPTMLKSESSAALSSAGSLFTLEDTLRWRLEREVERIRQRRVVRKERQAHQHHVLSLKRQQEMRRRFRTALTTHFVSQIECSTELLQQRILLLSSPQQRAEFEARLKAGMEPEMAERYAREQSEARAAHLSNVEKVFVLIDDGAQGKLHLLQILFGIFTLERVQQYATRVRGLSELINSQKLQKFVVDFVASPSPHDPRAFELTMSEFVDFVAIIEEVVDHCASVKLAVQQAEDEIEATLEAAASTPGVSRLRARVGIVSKKKVEQEIAALKATEEQVRLRHQLEQQEAFRDLSDSSALLPPKEEWEKNHHHRFIRFSEALPLYCCLCRRKKWELERRQHEELESAHRSQWAARCALKAKEEELKLVEANSTTGQAEPERDSEPPAVVEGTPATDDETHAEVSKPLQSCREDEITLDGSAEVDLIVFEVVRSLVALTERVMSEIPANDASRSPKRRVHTKIDRAGRGRANGRASKERKKATLSSSSESDATLQRAMKLFEDEESARKTLHTEEVRMLLLLERERRAMERPLLQVQDAAYNAYIRVLSHVVDPCSFLYRLEFQRCLSLASPQQLTLQVIDRAESSLGEVANHFVLQTLPCRSSGEAEHIFQQLELLQEKLRSGFVARVASVSRHTFQFFADSGMLVECWPVLFVVTEFFPEGSWLRHFRQCFLCDHHDASGAEYARMERHLIVSFRQVAAGLAAMHSLGVCHLNVKLDNVFVSSEVGPDLKLAGFLACKAAFTADQLRTGGAMQQCVDHCIAPPEVFQEDGQPVTAKADVWMLGCALYDALMLWQAHQLRRATRCERVIVRLRTLSEIFQELPIAASPTIRSLLRVLLHPDPLQRPPMSEVLDMLAHAE